MSPNHFLQEDADKLFCQTDCARNMFWEKTIRSNLFCGTGEYGLKWKLSSSEPISIY